MDHTYQDRVSLELGRQVAAQLSAHPELIAFAKSNLRRWSELNRGAPGLLPTYAEWAAILDRPMSDIITLLTAQTEEGQRLRQSSPFAGVLSPKAVWEIKRRLRDDQAAV